MNKINLNANQNIYLIEEEPIPPTPTNHRVVFKVRSRTPEALPYNQDQQPQNFATLLEQRDMEIVHLRSELRKAQQINEKLMAQLKIKERKMAQLFTQLEKAQESSVNLQRQLSKAMTQLQKAVQLFE